MIKKITAVASMLAIILSLCACGKSATTSTNTAPAADASVSSANSADSTAQDEAELAAIGDVEVNNGILTVAITMPTDFVDEGTTQEALDQGAGDSYVSAKLNDDGSVTYKLTKSQYHTMLSGIEESIDTAIQDMVDDENYSIAAVTHNDDYTSFDVTMDGTELGLADSFSAIAFYMYGGMYGIFSGNRGADITVNFLDPNGNIIETGNSANMGGSASTAQ